jgi:hypothetical protein
MDRHFGWAMLVAAGILLGWAFCTHQRTDAEPPVPAAQEQDDQIVDQLKEINAQLKELNGMLHSGSARVTLVINPGAGR